MIGPWVRACAGALSLYGTAFVLAQVGIAVVGPAAGQSGEQVLGASRGALPAGAAGTTSRVRPKETAEADRQAERLLEAARQDLARGNPLEGRRRLEILVATYPSSAAADDARQELARLYARGSPRDSARIGAAGQPSHSRMSMKEGPRAVDATAGRPVSLGSPSPSGRAAEPGRRDAGPRRRVSGQEFRAQVGDRVFFAERSAELGPRAGAVLAAQARWLRRAGHVGVVIEGHADDEGGNDFNEELARRRALAVRARLIEEGVDGARIAIETRGRFQPVAICSAPECAAQNRRAITVLQGSRSATLRGEPASAPLR